MGPTTCLDSMFNIWFSRAALACQQGYFGVHSLCRLAGLGDVVFVGRVDPEPPSLVSKPRVGSWNLGRAKYHCKMRR